MPADGFIKIKQWNGVSYSTGALSGLTANCTGVDVAGWIEVVGDDSATITSNRLGVIIITGSYYEIGTTDGVRSTTYQIPSNGTLQYHAGVEVETFSGSNVYEFYPCIGSVTALAANIATDSVRGKVCWIGITGLLRFGHDGANSTGGYIVPAGCKIRIGNVFLAMAMTVSRTINVLPSVSLITRYEFATTGGGTISIDKASIAWYMNLNQPYSVSLNNVGVLTAIVLTECASAITWNNVNVGQEAANSQIALTINYCFAGGTISNSIFTRATAAVANAVISMQDCENFIFTNCTSRVFVKVTGIAFCVTATRVNNTTFTNTILGGAMINLATCADVICTDTIYYDHPATTTTVAIAMYAFQVSSSCLRCIFDGLTFGGLVMNQPFAGILNIAPSGCKEIKLRNLGTYASPLELGDTLQENVTWSRVTTTCTVTKTSHGLKSNDVVFVTQASVASATITLTAKTITVTGANTFTFACLNAGATSGTLSYFPSVTQNIVLISSGAGANDVRIQRCYCIHNRTSPFVGDNTSKNVLFESFYCDWINTYSTSILNCKTKQVSGIPTFAAQSSIYGSHFIDNPICDFSQNTSGVSWSSAGSICTVTSNDHRMRTGMFINVTVCSNSTVVILGRKTITVTGSNTFTFACTSTVTTGTLTFEQLSDSRFAVTMNESTSETVDQYTVDNFSAGSGFTSAGTLYLPTINDQITFETPYYVLGYSKFPIAEATMGGGTITNYHITYAIDTGSGYSSFKNLSYARTGAGGSNGSTNVTMTDTTGVSPGDYIFGTNIAGNAYVVSITNATTIVVSSANLGTVSGILRFNNLPNEPTLPSTGFKIKLRIKTIATNATAISSLFFYMSSTATTRAYQYPLDQYNLTLTGLKNPTEVRVFDSANPTVEITGEETITTGTYTGLIDPTVYPNVIVAILSLGYQNIRLTDIDMSEGNVTIPIQQQIDRQYQNL